MIFRDLIQPEEFYDGCEVYANHECKIQTFNISRWHHQEYCQEYCWGTTGAYTAYTYTQVGLFINITHSAYRDSRMLYFKHIITNQSIRIIPIKYKPL
jgi:hypothetical protein